MLKIRKRGALLTFEYRDKVVNCTCITEPYITEIVEEFNYLELDNDMAGGIIHEVCETVSGMECYHGKNEKLIPMFLSERIRCIHSFIVESTFNEIIKKLDEQGLDTSATFVQGILEGRKEHEKKKNEMEKLNEDSS